MDEQYLNPATPVKSKHLRDERKVLTKYYQSSD